MLDKQFYDHSLSGVFFLLCILAFAALFDCCFVFFIFFSSFICRKRNHIVPPQSKRDQDKTFKYFISFVGDHCSCIVIQFRTFTITLIFALPYTCLRTMRLRSGCAYAAWSGHSLSDYNYNFSTFFFHSGPGVGGKLIDVSASNESLNYVRS